MNRTNFKEYKPIFYKSENILITFLKHFEKSILLVTIKGELPNGSLASNDCDYIQQELGITLLKLKPLMILFDLSQLKYRFGLGIVDAFRPLDEIDLFDGEGFKTAYVISDLNKLGLSSLWGFDINTLKPNIFLDFEQAYDYILTEYNNI